VKIPRSFQLMAHTITVKAIPGDKWRHKDCVGFYNYEKQRIELKDAGTTMPGHIFMHELLHAALSAMGHKLNNDEAFVDQLSGLLQQAFETAKYPRQTRRPRKPKRETSRRNT
jgi:hypothetical protein